MSIEKNNRRIYFDLWIVIHANTRCGCDYVLCNLKFEHFYEKEKFNDLIIKIHEVMMVYTLLKVHK